MNNQWDVLIIGGGLGSLTAGAMLAKGGAKVLLLERHDRPGGAATNFTRQGMTMEVGLHEMDGFTDHDPKKSILQELGILEQIKLIQVPEFYQVQGGPLKEAFTLPHGWQESKAAVLQRFPEQAQQVEAYFQELEGLGKALAQLSKPLGFYGKLLLPFRIWPLIKYDRTTVEQLLEKIMPGHEDLKLALGANLCYYGDSPKTLSFMYFGIAQASFLEGGGYYIQGGSQRLSEALVNVIEQHGGQVRLSREVTEIHLEEGRAVGVTHGHVSHLTSPHPKPIRDLQTESGKLVLTGAAPSVTARMLPVGASQNFLAPFAAHQPSTSVWCVYLGFNRPPADFGVMAYSNFLLPPWMERLSDYAVDLLAEPAGNQAPPFVLVDYSKIDSGLGGKDKYVGALCGVDHLTNWEGLDEAAYEAKKAAWLERILAELESHYPGIRSSIILAEMSTAKTMQHFLNTPGGAIYGFAQEPLSAGRHRLGPKTPIRGLYLSSAFSNPGGGFTGAILAGSFAAFAAAKELGVKLNGYAGVPHAN